MISRRCNGAKSRAKSYRPNSLRGSCGRRRSRGFLMLWGWCRKGRGQERGQSSFRSRGAQTACRGIKKLCFWRRDAPCGSSFAALPSGKCSPCWCSLIRCTGKLWGGSGVRAGGSGRMLLGQREIGCGLLCWLRCLRWMLRWLTCSGPWWGAGRPHVDVWRPIQRGS
jgi:hypothetical protein